MNTKGYYVTKNGTYQVRIGSKKNRQYIGTFDTEEAAVKAYRLAVSSVGKVEGKIIDITGKKFHKLTVVEYAGVTSKLKQGRWVCVCECGNTVLVRTASLNNGNTKSCGCFKKINCYKKPDGVASFNRVLKYYKKNAERRNLQFSLTEEQFKNIITKNCLYCNVISNGFFKRSGDNGYFIYNGVDRVDSLKGYTLDNCVSCCTICNRAKSNMPQADFLEYINRFKIKA